MTKLYMFLSKLVLFGLMLHSRNRFDRQRRIRDARQEMDAA